MQTPATHPTQDADVIRIMVSTDNHLVRAAAESPARSTAGRLPAPGARPAATPTGRLGARRVAQKRLFRRIQRGATERQVVRGRLCAARRRPLPREQAVARDTRADARLPAYQLPRKRGHQVSGASARAPVAPMGAHRMPPPFRPGVPQPAVALAPARPADVRRLSQANSWSLLTCCGRARAARERPRPDPIGPGQHARREPECGPARFHDSRQSRRPLGLGKPLCRRHPVVRALRQLLRQAGHAP